MDSGTQTHLVALRNLLTYRQTELQANVRAFRRGQLDGGAGASSEVADQKDAAARWQASELQGAQERRDLDELALVEAALHRLDAAAYGDCQDCGEPIPVQRLLTQPAALRCADCQNAFERAQERISLRGPV